MAKLHQTLNPIQTLMIVYLTIIPRARMGSESRAHWLRAREGERNNCFSKIQLVDKKYRDNNFSWQNAIQLPLFWFSKTALFATSGL